MAAAALRPLIHHDAGDLSALAGPGAVAQEEPRPIGGAIGVFGQLKAIFIRQVTAVKISLERLAGIDQRLELGC